MNWPKIAGYVGGTACAISALSQVTATIVPEEGFQDQIRDTLRWSAFFWAYAIFTIGLYLAKTSRKSIHVLVGVLAAFLCLSLRAEFVYAIGIAYSFWAFAKLDQTAGKLPF